MAFYGVGYQELMQYPINVFWLMNDNLARISAERDLRDFSNKYMSRSKEDIESRIQTLEVEYSRPFIVEEMLDVEGLNRLRALG